MSSFDGSRRLSNIELIKEYIRESLAEAAACTAGEELQDYQLRILRNTFRDLVRKDIEETVQKPG